MYNDLIGITGIIATKIDIAKKPGSILSICKMYNVPIYGMIIYLIDYKNGGNSRYACGGYYRFEFDGSVLMPHPYQESICW